VQEIKTMQTTPVAADELMRAKALLLRQIQLSEASIAGIASGFLSRQELDLPLDEPTLAAKRYIALEPTDIEAAFAKWMRPDDLVRVTQGPAPQ
jgi:zinc protease